jgi:hypothetical protein
MASGAQRRSIFIQQGRHLPQQRKNLPATSLPRSWRNHNFRRLVPLLLTTADLPTGLRAGRFALNSDSSVRRRRRRTRRLRRHTNQRNSALEASPLAGRSSRDAGQVQLCPKGYGNSSLPPTKGSSGKTISGLRQRCRSHYSFGRLPSIFRSRSPARPGLPGAGGRNRDRNGCPGHPNSFEPVRPGNGRLLGSSNFGTLANGCLFLRG